MHTALRSLFFMGLCWALSPQNARAFGHTDSIPSESRIIKMTTSPAGKSNKTQVKVSVVEAPEMTPVQGATVLFRRNADSVVGKITSAEGRCQFSIFPAKYGLRIQLTGLKSLDIQDIQIDKGKNYDIEVVMAPNQ